MNLDPSEEVTLRTMVAWYLPFDLGRFIDPIVCRISDVKMCNALMETTLVNFLNISLIIIQRSGLSSQTQPVSIPCECVHCLRFKPPNTQPARVRQLQRSFPTERIRAHVIGGGYPHICSWG
jgi:hypothetical protein